MRTIYLIRHGKPEFPDERKYCIGRTDLPLSEEGRTQIQALGETFAGRRIEKIYTSQNGFTNNFKHTKGVLSMARAMDPNSAGSQFFIMHETSPHLDGQYASFGKVVEGLDIVDKIAGVRTDWGDRPLKEQKIKKMTVDTFGEEYPEPEKGKER